MSFSDNPDLWRSQKDGDPEKSKSGDSGAENTSDSLKGPQSGSRAQASVRINKPSLTENGAKEQDLARNGLSGYEGRRVRMTPRNPNANSGKRSADPNKRPADPQPNKTGAESQNPQASRSGSGATRKPSVPLSSGSANRNTGSGVTPSASSGMAERLRGASNKSSSSSDKKDSGVLNKDTGKAAAGAAIKEGLKGGLKGAATGGLAGAAKGAAVGAAAGAADKVNEASAARQQAGAVRGQSNRNSILSSTSEGALKRGQDSLQSRFGGGGAGASAGKANAGKSAISPEQAASIAKAASTVQKEVATTVVKKAGVAVGTVVAVVYALVMTMITSVTGPITTAATAAYAATSKTCEAPTSSSSVSPSPSPSSSPSESSDASAAGSTSGIDRVSNVNFLTKVPVVTENNVDDLNANYAKYGLSGNAEIRADQIKNANTIMGVAKNIGFNQPGALIGIMTAMTESNLVNVEYGDLAGPDSRGLFQQRINGGWGVLADVMNPAYSSQAFFLGVDGLQNPGLDSVAGWEKMDPWVAAQQVQRSAFKDGSNYRDKLEVANALVGVLYEGAAPVPAVTSGKINPPKAGVNVQTSANGCGATPGGNTSTAAGDTYPAKNESYCRTSLCYAIQAADRVASGYRGECVDWAGWKLIEGTDTYGSYVPISMGNAADWGPGARAHGIAVDMTPRAGDAVYWAAGQGGSGDAGHIGTVQAVNGTKVTIEEYNFATALPGDTPETGGGRYHTRVIEASNATGYIHFIDPSKSKAENKEYLISKGILVPGKTNWPRK